MRTDICSRPTRLARNCPPPTGQANEAVVVQGTLDYYDWRNAVFNQPIQDLEKADYEIEAFNLGLAEAFDHARMETIVASAKFDCVDQKGFAFETTVEIGAPVRCQARMARHLKKSSPPHRPNHEYDRFFGSTESIIPSFTLAE